jgi:hypothetical protein
MFNAARRHLGMMLLPAVWAVLGVTASAQVGGQPSNIGNFPGMMPGQSGGLMPGNAGGLSPQMQQYMMLRALQGAGHHHGVQTGVANPIFGAGPQFDPSSGWMDDGSQAASNSTGRNSSDKRAAIRLAREQQKQLARERAESKKAKAPTKASKPKFNAD